MRIIESLETRTLFANFAAASVADLIAGINAANQAPGPDTITLSVGKTFTLKTANNPSDGGNGLPLITDDLTILGNGDTITRNAAADTPAFRFFDVAAGASLSLKNLTLKGGMVHGTQAATVGPTGFLFTLTSAQGGAILNRGLRNLDTVSLQNNTAQGLAGTPFWGGLSIPAVDAAGGSIYSTGILTMTDCAVSDNAAIGGAALTSATGASKI